MDDSGSEEIGEIPEEPEKVESEKSDEETNEKSEKWHKAMKKYLSHGAAKKPEKAKRSRRRSPKKDMSRNRDEIHSESQRLSRESAFTLPRWKPQPMTLQSILSKHNDRRTAMSLKPSAAEIAKMQKEEVDVKREEAESRRRRVIDATFGLQDVTPADPSVECKHWLAENDNTVSDVFQETTNTEVAKNASELPVHQWNDSDDDSLPPLIVVLEKTQEKCEELDSGVSLPIVNNAECESRILCPSSVGAVSTNPSDDLPEILPKEVDETCESQPAKKAMKVTVPDDDLVIEFRPEVLGNSDSKGYVDLDSDDEGGEKVGIEELKSRFLEQSRKSRPRFAQTAEVSSVHNDIQADSDKGYLKPEHDAHNTEAEKVAEMKKPGARLHHLKEKLREGLMKLRAEVRKRKMETLALDEEFAEEDEDENEEMTDQSDSDEEKQEESDDWGKNKTSEFVDHSAVEDDKVDELSEGDDVDTDRDEDKINLHLSDDDDDDDDDDLPQVLLNSNRAWSSVDRDSGPYGLTSSLNLSTQDMFAPEKDSSQAFRLELGTDDAQNLLKIDDDVIISPKAFDASLEETQSLLLDENGFLKSTCAVKTNEDTNRVPRGLSLLLKGRSLDSSANPLDFVLDGSSSPDKMDDLIDLCSGQFTASIQNNALTNDSFSETRSSNLSVQRSECSNHRPTEQRTEKSDTLSLTATQNGELLQLCSGSFSTQEENSPVVMDENANDASLAVQADNISEDDDDFGVTVDDDFLHSTKSKTKKIASAFSDVESENEDEDEENEKASLLTDIDTDEDEVNGENELQSDSEESLIIARERKKKLRAEFLEEEAELSGSEADSDENEDLEEEHDILEKELGDEDEVGTEDQLRSQVGKVHLKSLMDEDKRQLKLYQERFLVDGDLHSENGGRERKYMWKNIDDSGDYGANLDDWDLENRVGEDETELEIKRRKERFERERWIEKQMASQNDEEKEDSESQLIKLGRLVLQRSNSGNFGSSSSKSDADAKPTPNTPKSLCKSSHQNHGSFLKKRNLSRIAEITKPVSSHTGSTTNRNFVFSALSPDEREKKRKQMCEHLPSMRLSKRTKLNEETKNKRMQPTSIFKLMN